MIRSVRTCERAAKLIQPLAGRLVSRVAGVVPRCADQGAGELLAVRRVQGETHRTLGLVQARPVETAAVRRQRPPTDVDVAADRIDANDVGAELGQGQAAERCRDEGGNLDDA